MDDNRSHISNEPHIFNNVAQSGLVLRFHEGAYRILPFSNDIKIQGRS